MTDDDIEAWLLRHSRRETVIGLIMITIGLLVFGSILLGLWITRGD